MINRVSNFVKPLFVFILFVNFVIPSNLIGEESAPSGFEEQLVQGMHQYLKDRAKQEMILYVIDKLKQWFDSNEIAKEVFPATRRLVEQTKNIDGRINETVWQSAFQEDLDHLLVNILNQMLQIKHPKIFNQLDDELKKDDGNPFSVLVNLDWKEYPEATQDTIRLIQELSDFIDKGGRLEETFQEKVHCRYFTTSDKKEKNEIVLKTIDYHDSFQEYVCILAEPTVQFLGDKLLDKSRLDKYKTYIREDFSWLFSLRFDAKPANGDHPLISDYKSLFDAEVGRFNTSMASISDPLDFLGDIRSNVKRYPEKWNRLNAVLGLEKSVIYNMFEEFAGILNKNKMLSNLNVQELACDKPEATDMGGLCHYLGVKPGEERTFNSDSLKTHRKEVFKKLYELLNTEMEQLINGPIKVDMTADASRDLEYFKKQKLRQIANSLKLSDYISDCEMEDPIQSKLTRPCVLTKGKSNRVTLDDVKGFVGAIFTFGGYCLDSTEEDGKSDFSPIFSYFFAINKNLLTALIDDVTDNDNKLPTLISKASAISVSERFPSVIKRRMLLNKRLAERISQESFVQKLENQEYDNKLTGEIDKMFDYLYKASGLSIGTVKPFGSAEGGELFERIFPWAKDSSADTAKLKKIERLDRVITYREEVKKDHADPDNIRGKSAVLNSLLKLLNSDHYKNHKADDVIEMLESDCNNQQLDSKDLCLKSKLIELEVVEIEKTLEEYYAKKIIEKKETHSNKAYEMMTALSESMPTSRELQSCDGIDQFLCDLNRFDDDLYGEAAGFFQFAILFFNTVEERGLKSLFSAEAFYFQFGLKLFDEVVSDYQFTEEDFSKLLTLRSILSREYKDLKEGLTELDTVLSSARHKFLDKFKLEGKRTAIRYFLGYSFVKVLDNNQLHCGPFELQPETMKERWKLGHYLCEYSKKDVLDRQDINLWGKKLNNYVDLLNDLRIQSQIGPVNEQKRQDYLNLVETLFLAPNRSNNVMLIKGLAQLIVHIDNLIKMKSDPYQILLFYSESLHALLPAKEQARVAQFLDFLNANRQEIENEFSRHNLIREAELLRLKESLVTNCKGEAQSCVDVYHKINNDIKELQETSRSDELRNKLAYKLFDKTVVFSKIRSTTIADAILKKIASIQSGSYKEDLQPDADKMDENVLLLKTYQEILELLLSDFEGLEYLDYLKSVFQIQASLNKKEYDKVAMEIAVVFEKLQGSEAPRQFYSLVTLTTMVSNAKTKEDVVTAFQSTFEPAGSYRSKRISKNKLNGINMYLGLIGGREKLEYQDTVSVDYSYTGLWIPIGYEVSFGIECGLFTSGSWLITFFDLGAPFQALSRSEKMKTKEEDKEQFVEEEKNDLNDLSQYVSPGLWGMFGIMDLPLSFGFGFQVKPNNRKFFYTYQDEKVTFAPTSIQLGISLSMDFPLMFF